MSIRDIIKEQLGKTKWGNSEEEIVTNLSSSIMSHINPMKVLVKELQQAMEDNDTERARQILTFIEQEQHGLANIFKEMQDYLDNN